MTTSSLPPHLTGNAIRQTFIDYFVENGHTFVPSSSLVPGGDSTLLFTNSGMVQFKDVFLGIDKRPYTRAANSQKSMRVAGKHNDLDDVGRDDTHHTLFEMLGNWSFGDYYKKEAIEWAWHLLTEVWGLDKTKLWATVFKDQYGVIPSDEEAKDLWRAQPGFVPDQVLYFGRKDNFWEMAETGPCGPCSEIHYDRGPAFCNQQDVPGHVCGVNGDCPRYLEIWNLVFIQYNRMDETTFKPLPAKHVDTGMGFERIVSILQGKSSNYRTDLLWPLILKTAEIVTERTSVPQGDPEIDASFTPYRVIADHARAASFLIADGVIPGNLGRNYIARMIIRRAYRFGGKIGLTEPFMARVAAVVIENYGKAYPELVKNRDAILAAITREEEQFQRTLDRGTANLQSLLDKLEASGQTTLPGEQAADLYTTYGMPLEITKDIARERGLDVDETGFRTSMDEHRLASGKGTAMGVMGGDDTEIYAKLLHELQEEGKLGPDGVKYNPYHAPTATDLTLPTTILALVRDGQPTPAAYPGDQVEVVLPETLFYLESGGQVDDTGIITSTTGDWEIKVTGIHRPAAGILTHTGEVVRGYPQIGDAALAQVDAQRRADIIRNHTATHLLHTGLRKFLGAHARQAGSLVAPDRLRFDFTHPEAVTSQQIEQIEQFVNEKILGNFNLHTEIKPLQQALDEGATALFGEKYGEVVRNVTIADFSNELCGGTHCPNTGFIGSFLITSEGSAAAGIRRIEAITGREAFNYIQSRRHLLAQTARTLETAPDKLPEKAEGVIEHLGAANKQIAALREALALAQIGGVLDQTEDVKGVKVLTATLENVTGDTLRSVADKFRERHPEGAVAVFATVNDGRPVIIAAVTKDLNGRGIKAGDLAGFVAKQLGGGGGGSPTLAQAGGKDASKLAEALGSVKGWVEGK
ncbi:MAG: alanine--tRNA ligase [Anaerolineales bacterium]|nr:alanine--tRNA ligase [Anaerolineales bacterium]